MIPGTLYAVGAIEAVAVAAAADQSGAVVSAIIGGAFLLVNTLLTRWVLGHTPAAPGHRRRAFRVSVLVAPATGVIATAALVVSLADQSGRISDIQHSRRQAASDTCQVIRRLFLFVTPAARQPRSLAILRYVGLGNCHAYSERLVDGR